MQLEITFYAHIESLSGWQCGCSFVPYSHRLRHGSCLTGPQIQFYAALLVASSALWGMHCPALIVANVFRCMRGVPCTTPRSWTSRRMT